MFTDLAPIVHQHKWDLCRVPLTRQDGEYHVFVGDNHVRHFKEDTLPDCIKTKLTMILALPNQIVPDSVVGKMEIYKVPLDSPEFSEIGWRVSESYFCVVLDYVDLASLRGENIYGDYA